MAWMPGAIRKEIPKHNVRRATERNRLNLHVAVSEASSLYDFFNGRSGGVESHFYIRRDGTVEQYRDTGYQADANTDANNFAISIETQGMEHGEWTPQQMASIKALCSWANKAHGIPLTTVKAWDGSGIGYHTQFPGRWDKRGATCPGPDRKRQFARELVPWLDSGAPATGAATPTKTYTREDVKRFQRVHGVKDDGLYGPATARQAEAIRRVVKTGVKAGAWDLVRYWRVIYKRPKGERSAHELRRGIQWALGVTVDGYWQEQTDAAWLAIRDQHKMKGV